MNRDELLIKIANGIRNTGFHIAVPVAYANLEYLVKNQWKKPTIVQFNPKVGAKIAIFAIFQPNGLSEFCKQELQYLKKLGYDIVISVPHVLQGADYAFVSAECRYLITRANFGRDFGSYRDAILGVGFIEIACYERILIVNDSIFLPVGNTKQFEQEFLSCDADVVALCENTEFTAHLGSFFVDFSVKIFCSHPMQAFWQQYRPLSSRHHAVHNGEFKLSRTIYQQTQSIHVVYSQERIIRDMMSGKLNLEQSWLQTYPGLSHMFEHVKVMSIDMAKKPARRDSRVHEIVIADEIRKKLARSSNPHSFGLQLIEFFGAPFLKRDMCQRDAVDTTQIKYVLRKIETKDYVEKIMIDFLKTGTRHDLSPWGALMLLLRVR